MTSADDFAAILAMPTCRLGVAVARQQVLTLVFLAPNTPTIPASGTLCEAISTALDAYLQDGTPFPALPLAQRGTPFQRRGWGGSRPAKHANTVKWPAHWAAPRVR